MQIKEQKGFQVLPKCWVVERTFAWLNGSRRLSKDYETSCCSAETMNVEFERLKKEFLGAHKELQQESNS